MRKLEPYSFSRTKFQTYFQEYQVFSIWKSLRLLQEARIKIVAHALYTNLFSIFFLIHAVFSSAGKWKNYCDRCSTQQVRPQTTVQWYILQYYSSMSINFDMISKRHTLPIVYTVNTRKISIIVLLRVNQKYMVIFWILSSKLSLQLNQSS